MGLTVNDALYLSGLVVTVWATAWAIRILRDSL